MLNKITQYCNLLLHVMRRCEHLHCLLIKFLILKVQLTENHDLYDHKKHLP